jgi:hypothetical protein
LLQFILSSDYPSIKALRDLLIVSENNKYFLPSSKELEEIALRDSSKDLMIIYLEMYKKNGDFNFLLISLFSDTSGYSSEDLFSDSSEEGSEISDQIDNETENMLNFDDQYMMLW